MRCNNCGWNNPDGLTKCQKCNQLICEDLSEAAQQVGGGAKNGESALNEERIVSCRKCGYPFAPDSEICPNCGTIVNTNIGYFEPSSAFNAPNMGDDVDTKATVIFNNGNSMGENPVVAADSSNKATVVATGDELERIVSERRAADMNMAGASSNKATVVATGDELERIVSERRAADMNMAGASSNKATVVATGDELERIVSERRAADMNRAKKEQMPNDANYSNYSSANVATPSTVENSSFKNNASLNKTVFEMYPFSYDEENSESGNYAAPVQDAYEPAAQENYAPVAQDAYEPAAQENYAPVAQDAYEPAAQENYAPVAQDAYEPAAQEGYESSVDDSFVPIIPNVCADEQEVTPELFSYNLQSMDTSEGTDKIEVTLTSTSPIDLKSGDVLLIANLRFKVN